MTYAGFEQQYGIDQKYCNMYLDKGKENHIIFLEVEFVLPTDIIPK